MNKLSVSVRCFILTSLLLMASLACGMTGSGEPDAPAPSGGDGAGACDYMTDQYVNIAGDYSVEGGKTDQSGGNYSGEAVVTQIEQNCFHIEWRIEGRTRAGTATLVGNIVSGTWQEDGQSGEFSGTANSDGTIQLAWGFSGGDTTEYVERLTKK
ncbi:MAG: hypothetical protein IT315_01055 [Anaerolineales bacterium]|nr:hypothetical protein [Anaerolineales bacterium]